MSGKSVLWAAADAASWIVAQLSVALSVPVADVDRDATFSSLGLSSQAAAAMVNRLGQHLGRELPVATLWAFPTVNGLASAAAIEDPLTYVRSTQRPAGDEIGEPLAIVSMAARLPGADSATQMWDLILAGGDAIGPPPPGGFKDAPGSMSDAGYLSRGLDLSDHRFFHLTPRETSVLDPAQRLVLEVCCEAIEASSMPRTGLRGSSTDAYASSIWNESGAASRPGQHTMHTATGPSLSMVANRVSYSYDLQGPSVTLDSACSSSLVAVHSATQVSPPVPSYWAFRLRGSLTPPPSPPTPGCSDSAAGRNRWREWFLRRERLGLAVSSPERRRRCAGLRMAVGVLPSQPVPPSPTRSFSCACRRA
ncbi:beta-ketoacyl synthase N-terminal-like domain-containing protein [Streptomyces sp. NPDC059002]|uniref:beta-ketoacyl synthase N-terminal-like domain-containing protein n=1 Tax=Streptomyces sp. NPDC059002 TaxID=3346690 RepID=UPI0036BD1FC8